jgi:hypothetical protein
MQTTKLANTDPVNSQLIPFRSYNMLFVAVIYSTSAKGCVPVHIHKVFFIAESYRKLQV